MYIIVEGTVMVLCNLGPVSPKLPVIIEPVWQFCFFVLDSSFKRFENCTVKLSAKESKCTSLEVRTHPTILENLISKYDFGLVKLPGLSRNVPLAFLWWPGCLVFHQCGW